MDREVVRELIQKELNLMSLHRELSQILATGYRHGMMKREYRELREILGGSGASERVAADIVASIET
jgi:lipid-A-disaccharide synthase